MVRCLLVPHTSITATKNNKNPDCLRKSFGQRGLKLCGRNEYQAAEGGVSQMRYPQDGSKTPCFDLHFKRTNGIPPASRR